MTIVRSSLLLTMLLALPIIPAMGQTDTTISLPRASALLQAGNFAEAQRMLEILVEREPANGRASFAFTGLATPALPTTRTPTSVPWTKKSPCSGPSTRLPGIARSAVTGR